ncbi:MAG: family 16 glycoside hydrolase, partial [Planctomycetota bacterium]
MLSLLVLTPFAAPAHLALPVSAPTAASTTNPAPQGAWTDLFDGKTLEGWTQRNGTATYQVVDGTIVGTTSKGSPNSFLC